MVLEPAAQPRRWEQGFAFAYSKQLWVRSGHLHSAPEKLPFSE